MTGERPLHRLRMMRRSPARQTRGRYKIFLGMAAGVGKTYRMLQEGQAEAEAGRDVVIGYLEPHGRERDDRPGRRTSRRVPRREVEYRGTQLAEMDLQAVLRARARAVPDRRARPHQRPRRPSTRSATRTSPTCSRPGSMSSRRSTSSTSRASTTRSPS